MEGGLVGVGSCMYEDLDAFVDQITILLPSPSFMIVVGAYVCVDG